MPKTIASQSLPTLEECLSAFGLACLNEVPIAEIKIPASVNCREYCRIWSGRVTASFREYFSFVPIGSGYEQRYVPMIIDLNAYPDWPSFEAYVKGFGKGQRLRMAQRAERNGFYVKRFNWGVFLPDIYEINTSKDVRSGGEMSASYRRTVDEMGGVPTEYLGPIPPQCGANWDQQFGVFREDPGHRQGDVLVNERLIGYVALRRHGDFAMYAMFLGHGDYLSEGVMVLAHLKIVRWLIEHRGEFAAANLRYLLYGGMQSGTAGLIQWKRLAGFRPYRVFCTFAACPELLQG